MASFKDYYSLVKPGVLYGNALTTAAGFLLASTGVIDVILFIFLMVGTTLIIASACVMNNYLDQDIDSKMERTKTRVIVSGKVKGSHAVILSIVMGVVGIVMLYLTTNILVVIVGVIGFIDYVVLYGMLSKRLSIHGTLVGSISGAAPILAGYVAVSGAIDLGSILVFAALFIWQMPEFYSISIYRRKEYAAAKIPVISVVKGVQHTSVQILIYTIAFVVVTALLTVFGYTGYIYLIVMMALGVYWIYLTILGVKSGGSDETARKIFKFSLIILLVFCLMISIGARLP